MELPQWMCNELDLADKVVIVSDEAYAEKADGHLGGVGWETSKRNRDRQIILDMIRSLRERQGPCPLTPTRRGAYGPDSTLDHDW
jgi:hypothetical protein